MVYRPHSRKKNVYFGFGKKRKHFLVRRKKNKKVVFITGIKHSKTQHLKNEKNKKKKKTKKIQN